MLEVLIDLNQKLSVLAPAALLIRLFIYHGFEPIVHGTLTADPIFQPFFEQEQGLVG